MAATKTRKAPPPPARPARAPRSAATSRSRPFLRFYHSAALRKRTLAVLDAVEKGPDARARANDLAELVVDLANSGLDYYFMRSLRAAKAGFIVEQSAGLGLAAAMQVIGPVIRSVIGRMDAAQVLSVSRSIRELMT